MKYVFIIPLGMVAGLQVGKWLTGYSIPDKFHHGLGELVLLGFVAVGGVSALFDHFKIGRELLVGPTEEIAAPARPPALTVALLKISDRLVGSLREDFRKHCRRLLRNGITSRFARTQRSSVAKRATAVGQQPSRPIGPR